MNATILIKPCGIGNFECLQLDGDKQQMFVGDSERVAEAAELSSLILLAPAEAITLREVDFEDSERKMLQQTLQYSLEDDLAEDVDELHFAMGPLSADSVPLAVVKREFLQQWLEAGQSQGLEFQQIVSELQLLPLGEQSWTLLVDDNEEQSCRWLLKSAESEGFAIEVDSASLAIQLLLDQSEQIPTTLVVYCKEQQQAAIRSQLPEMLRGIVEWRDDDYWDVMAAGLRDAQPINLLQGDFELKFPWLKWWKSWKIAAVLLLSATLFQFASSYVKMQVLESRHVALRAEIESSYRTVVPKGAVMDPERQLRRAVSNMRGTGGASFVATFDKVARVLASIEGLSLQSLNYTEKNAEFRLTILADAFDDVETARINMEKSGLKAELTGSSAEGGKTRARLRIKG